MTLSLGGKLFARFSLSFSLILLTAMKSLSGYLEGSLSSPNKRRKRFQSSLKLFHYNVLLLLSSAGKGNQSDSERKVLYVHNKGRFLSISVFILWFKKNCHFHSEKRGTIYCIEDIGTLKWLFLECMDFQMVSRSSNFLCKTGNLHFMLTVIFNSMPTVEYVIVYVILNIV